MDSRKRQTSTVTPAQPGDFPLWFEQNERVDVKAGNPRHIQANPHQHNQRLRDQKYRRAKKPGKRLGLQRKPVIAKW